MRLMAGLIAACLLAAPAMANIAPAPVDYPEQAGQTVFAFFDSFNAGNLEGIASTYSDSGEFTWIENGVIAYGDKAAAVAGMKERLAATPGARLETPEGWSVIAAGDGGAEIVAPITLKLKDPRTGEDKAVLSGVLTLLLRLEDGEWRIVTGHTSTAVSMQ